MKDKDNKLIYEAYTSESNSMVTVTFIDTNQKGRRIPRLNTLSNTEARQEMVGLDENNEEVAYYEADFEWSWYGSYYSQTETSPAEEPIAEDIQVTRVIDRTEDRELDVTDNVSLVSKIQDVIRGELEGGTVSLFEAYGWEVDDGY